MIKQCETDWPPWESSRARTIADLKEHKALPHQKHRVARGAAVERTTHGHTHVGRGPGLSPGPVMIVFLSAYFQKKMKNKGQNKPTEHIVMICKAPEKLQIMETKVSLLDPCILLFIRKS
ncbi:hypothetical protein CHARACLAT_029478 [Characodon lateralis]|uniref:Uncharacterized protein n=1 Tax=Characodon lateralis TaxID=208331 RepID=A0ABU7DV98_9TELE|nr:hypothetical protein [Characodon lateralis]